jgi:catechol 2,3-dioxygenase-like lactoylglutathione lyase family enzyme
MLPMEQRLTIVTLGVSDLKKSTTFYTDLFGWEKLPSSNDDITFIRLNGILVSLYGREKLAEDATIDPQGQGFKGFTLAYNTRSKEEVDQLIADLESKGVQIVKRPQEVFWGGYSGYIADPDNNLWEIAFNPFLPLDNAGNVG